MKYSSLEKGHFHYELKRDLEEKFPAFRIEIQADSQIIIWDKNREFNGCMGNVFRNLVRETYCFNLHSSWFYREMGGTTNGMNKSVAAFSSIEDAIEFINLEFAVRKF